MKDVKTRLTTVVLATAGCTSCIMGGAVDPAPPPLTCEQAANGEVLYAYARYEKGLVLVTIYAEGTYWEQLEVTEVVDAEIVSIDVETGALEFQYFESGASFTVRGVLTGRGGLRCPVSRTFTVTSNDAFGNIEIALAVPEKLPLEVRHAAAIAVVRNDGNVVELEARSEYPGHKLPRWNVSGGEIVERVALRALWRLPEEPGVYQVQLALDYGEDGLGFDAVAFEVA